MRTTLLLVRRSCVKAASCADCSCKPMDGVEGMCCVLTVRAWHADVQSCMYVALIAKPDKLGSCASRHQRGCMGYCATGSVRAVWPHVLSNSQRSLLFASRMPFTRPSAFKSPAKGGAGNAHTRWARPFNSLFHSTSHREAVRDAGCPAIRQPNRRLVCVCTAVLVRHQFIVACRQLSRAGWHQELTATYSRGPRQPTTEFLRRSYQAVAACRP